jgi:SAM-dependent methyltransferase
VTTATKMKPARWNVFTGLADAVCRRAFSSPEAFLYEVTIARALADIVTPELARFARGRVLDVGAGGGTVAGRLVLDHGCTVVALDPSAAQVRRASRLAARVEGLSACSGSAESLPFDDNSFDSVVSSCAWKHWPEPVIGVSECLRVLRPGGTL